MRLFPKLLVQRVVSVGSDQVIAAWPVPGGSRVNGFWLEHTVQSPLAMKIEEVPLYGVTGYVVPVPDPDEAVTPDVLWDRTIPKDTGAGSDVLDL